MTQYTAEQVETFAKALKVEAIRPDVGKWAGVLTGAAILLSAYVADLRERESLKACAADEAIARALNAARCYYEMADAMLQVREEPSHE